MTAYIHTIRALSALIFQRLLVPAGLFVGIIFLLILVGIAVLSVKFSAWWLVLYLFVTPVMAVLLGLGVFGWVISERLLPRQLNKKEKRLVLDFVDKVIRIAEARATPVPILGLIVAKDIVTRNKESYVERVIKDTSSLREDFQKISRLFA